MVENQGQAQQRPATPPAQDQEQHVIAPVEKIDTTDVDAILDEIDAVLEQDAESFVRHFVQKGGQ